MAAAARSIKTILPRNKSLTRLQNTGNLKAKLHAQKCPWQSKYVCPVHHTKSRQIRLARQPQHWT